METCDFSSQRGCDAFSHCPANLTHFLGSTRPITSFYFLSWAEWLKEWLQGSPSCICLRGGCSWGCTRRGHLSHPFHENPSVPRSGRWGNSSAFHVHSLSCLFSSSWTFSTSLAGIYGFSQLQALEGGGQRSHQVEGWWEMLLPQPCTLSQGTEN